MATKLAEFLDTHQIDHRRLLAASRQLERLRPEDRAIRLQQRQARRAEAGAGAAAQAERKKPRSGRVITQQLLEKAALGQPITGPAKTRIVRALNRVLEQKKQGLVELNQLF